ncbi:PPK2 family polyphosphate kinase [Telluribacter sp.]|jgi:PPK2 family polyphosphate:nucleotide phosphotransferase|uniref:PPK2 family polyphosphate kinase n=1 Tax=Telluribacter sp. TaxID=1978767 RepID=UPI002E16049B|nr:PPK2 family polyphosphate kinase [Telluribacter sp.]
MNIPNPDALKYDGTRPLILQNTKTKLQKLYSDKKQYKQLLTDYIQEIDELQSIMYAHDRYGLLLIFQAMDAAGKDGTIKHVLTGVNPMGIKVHPFKRPTENELEHDYLWRASQLLPQRGMIAVFNRSYYEEVLVVKVHPEILIQQQRLPVELTTDLEKVWEQRYQDIVNYERYLYHNGIRTVKFFLNVSRQEQATRLISRIENQAKNWKFEEGDVKEREHWDQYQQAYEDCINATATEIAPWYVIPADNKKNMRLMVGDIVVKEMKKLDMSYPKVDKDRGKELHQFIEVIQSQDNIQEIG